MPYVYNTPEDVREMLAAIGASSIDALFESIPSELRLKGELKLPPAMSEMELTHHLGQLSAKNASALDKICFLGGGSYDHFIPAAVDAIASRGEFYTSYTPYQPEVSQGNLQAMFEYQTMICQLTGLDVSNASLYDGGSAAVEAVLMCMSVTKRGGKVVTAASVHPEYRRIVETYFACIGATLMTVPAPAGVVDMDALAAAIDEETACVLIQHPNFFGGLEDVERIAKLAHDKGAMLVQSFDPISVGLLKRPGDLGADIAVAEGQGLGSPLQFGGPYLGILACKEAFVRRMPGRICGQTVDRRGKRCYVLTLQTREQHIRREKATSNICTNQTLFALRATIYLSLLGPKGLAQTAEHCVRKARYAAEKLTQNDRFSLKFTSPTFKEFVIRDEGGNVTEVIDECLEEGFLAGVPLGPWYPELSDCFLIAVTEKRTKQEIDRLAQIFARLSKGSTVHA